MNFSPGEARLLRKLFEEMNLMGKNHLVIMAKIPPWRRVTKGEKPTSVREITPEWVEDQKLRLPIEARELSRLGYIRLFVDGSNTGKNGKIEFVAHLLPDGLKAFRADLERRAALVE